jgi:alpha-L-rhamnosidase
MARLASLTDVSWQGRWIAAEQPPALDDISVFGDHVTPRPFSRLLFRKSFQLDAVPGQARARLTADSRYLLLVNGQEAGRGPIRSQPRRLRYDEYELAPFLRDGSNVLAVLVTYYGRANAFWQPAVTNGGEGTDAVLVFEARLGDMTIVSDESWRVSRSPAWRTISQHHADGVPFERLDARELPERWWSADFDDRGWDAAAVVVTTHTGGFARSQPPTSPYGALLPRGIAALEGRVLEPALIVDSSTATVPDQWADDHPARRIQQLLGVRRARSGAAGFPISAQLDKSTVHAIEVDFGRVVAGFVHLKLRAPAGTVVDFHYREVAWDSGEEGAAAAPLLGAQYVARGLHDEFAALELIGLRHVHLLIHVPVQATVELASLTLRECTYPFAGGAYFDSDDAELNALYAAGVRTVALNSLDSFVDCPTREQRAWVGDGVVHQMVHFAANEDWRLADNYIELSNSPRPDGILPMSVAGDIEAGRGITIPDWSLHWVHGVHNQYRYSGNRSALLRALPSVERVLRWYEPYIDGHGTISDVPEWNLVDWASVFTTGRSSILTALWCRGLAEFAELSDAVGNSGSAAWARRHYESARAGYEDFWNEERGTYVDHFLDGHPMPAASQAAGAAAIASGLAPSERWSRVIDTITDEDALVVRSWIGGNDRGEHFAKLADQARGVQAADWDVDREIVLAEPFFSYVVHDAVARAGRAAELPRLLRRWSQFLVDGYDTFGECWGWGTHVHGWSSTPARDLVFYVLGISPGRPGFERVRVAPAWPALSRMSGAAPTPHGLVTVSIHGRAVEINSPVAVEFVDRSGHTRNLAPGNHALEIR